MRLGRAPAPPPCPAAARTAAWCRPRGAASPTHRGGDAPTASEAALATAAACESCLKAAVAAAAAGAAHCWLLLLGVQRSCPCRQLLQRRRMPQPKPPQWSEAGHRCCCCWRRRQQGWPLLALPALSHWSHPAVSVLSHRQTLLATAQALSETLLILQPPVRAFLVRRHGYLQFFVALRRLWGPVNSLRVPWQTRS